MKRTPITISPFFKNLGVPQGEIIEDYTRIMFVTGQVAMDEETGEPCHIGDMHAQMAMAIDNVERVLKEADMDLSDVVHYFIYTTDVQQTNANLDVLTKAFGDSTPTGSALHGVTELYAPGAMFEISAIAMD